MLLCRGTRGIPRLSLLLPQPVTSDKWKKMDGAFPLILVLLFVLCLFCEGYNIVSNCCLLCVIHFHSINATYQGL